MPPKRLFVPESSPSVLLATPVRQAEEVAPAEAPKTTQRDLSFWVSVGALVVFVQMATLAVRFLPESSFTGPFLPPDFNAINAMKTASVFSSQLLAVSVKVMLVYLVVVLGADCMMRPERFKQLVQEKNFMVFYALLVGLTVFLEFTGK